MTPFATNFFKRRLGKIILITSAAISMAAFAWFYAHGQQNLSDYDAIARLNIARKILESTYPGLGQLGGIWLPFPQLLMLPFIWNDFLWHTGIAGAIVSMLAFTGGAYYLYRTVLLLTKNYFAAVIAWAAFVSNANLLFLQSMAMSESLFLAGIVMIGYGFAKWTTDRQISSLLLAAFFVMVVTLTRYEGYAILLAAITTLALCLFAIRRPHEPWSKIEGIMVLFVTLAALGVGLWTIYSWAIYHDPIYWYNLYSGNKSVVDAPAGTTIPALSGTEILNNAVRQRPITYSAATYSWAMAMMIGLPVALTGLLGYAVATGQAIRQTIRRQLDVRLLPLVVITTILMVYLIVGYWRGLIPPIDTPAIAWSTLLTKASNLAKHDNIRYGIIMLPIVAIFLGFLAAKKRLIADLVLLVIVEQFALGLTTQYFVQFQLPQVSTYQPRAEAVWLGKHYDRGEVLVSAQRQEQFIFTSGLPYSDFIYEGSRDIWAAALKDPAKLARWVVTKDGDDGDAVNQFINHAQLQADYDLVVRTSEAQIYKLKASIKPQP